MEPLVLCATHEAGERVLAAAEICGDERLKLAVQGGDLVAMDEQYHKSCYKNVTRAKILDRVVRLISLVSPCNCHVLFLFCENPSSKLLLSSLPTCGHYDIICV